MLIRTHLAITLFFILLLISSVEHKLIFFLIAIIATFIPDVDLKFSSFGKYKLFRIPQLFLKHRGIIHTFTFLILIIFFLVLFFPVLSLGFFVGYSSHLFADSFTSKGITPFYPYRKKTNGKIKTGRKSEISVFVIFIIADVFLALLKIELIKGLF